MVAYNLISKGQTLALRTRAPLPIIPKLPLLKRPRQPMTTSRRKKTWHRWCVKGELLKIIRSLIQSELRLG